MKNIFSQLHYSNRLYMTLCIIAFTCIAVFTFFSNRSYFHNLQNLDSSYQVLNLSNQQQTLTQQAAFLANSIIISEPAQRSEIRPLLRNVLSQMRTTHNDLIYGDLGRNIPPLISEEITKIYFQPPNNLNQKTQLFYNQIENLLSASDRSSTTEDLTTYSISPEDTTKLFSPLERVTNLLKNKNLSQIQESQQSQSIYLFLIVLILILSGFYIFKPMTKKIIHDQAQLLEKDKKLHAVLNHTANGVILTDKNGLIEVFNKASEIMYGYKQEEIIGKNIDCLIPQSNRNSYCEPLERYKSKNNIDSFNIERESLGLNGLGSTFPVSISVSKIQLLGETKYFNTIRDISNKKKNEAQIKCHSQILMESINEVFIIDAETSRFVYVNNAGQKNIGYRLDELLKMNFKNLMRGSEATLDYDSLLSELINNTVEKTTFESIHKRKDNSEYYAESHVMLANYKGRSSYVVSVIDITEHTTAKKDIEKTLERLSESNAELERFAYVASHDLQEPLRMIRNFSKLLENRLAGKLEPETQEYLSITSSSAERMQDLVQDLLEYARVGEEEKVLKNINFEKIIGYIKENLSEQIIKTNAHITHSKLPSLLGNPVQISCVLQNLIGNSIKYQKPDEIPEVHISVTDKVTHWEFCVTDNGIGMEQQYCEKIFLPFQRLHHKEEYSGTGIGLAICRKIIEKFGGEIWVTSTVDIGTNVYFTIPKPDQKLAA